MSKLLIKSFATGSLGCNCSIIYSEESKEAIIIDPGDDEDLIMNEVHQNGLKVKLLLHTHAHFDHISCSKAVKEKTESKICLHKGDELLYKSLPVQRSMFGFGAQKVEVLNRRLLRYFEGKSEDLMVYRVIDHQIFGFEKKFKTFHFSLSENVFSIL